MKKALLFVAATAVVLAGGFVREGEKLLYGFTTQKGKIVTIAVGANESYLVYRYGKAGTVELEYPRHRNNSFRHFTYSHYFRGGGAGNEGLDLNTLSFANHGYTYRIFDDYSAADGRRDIGIDISRKGKKIATIRGQVDSVKGSLSSLEDYPVQKR